MSGTVTELDALGRHGDPRARRRASGRARDPGVLESGCRRRGGGPGHERSVHSGQRFVRTMLAGDRPAPVIPAAEPSPHPPEPFTPYRINAVITSPRFLASLDRGTGAPEVLRRACPTRQSGSGVHSARPCEAFGRKRLGGEARDDRLASWLLQCLTTFRHAQGGASCRWTSDFETTSGGRPWVYALMGTSIFRQRRRRARPAPSAASCPSCPPDMTGRRTPASTA